MAVPIVPTVTTIASEALAKAGHSNPSLGLTTRAEGVWMEEIKNDLAALFGGKKLKFLQAERVLVLTEGQSEYDEPTDFYSDLSKTLVFGQHTGTAQAGDTNKITLAADEDIDADTIIGREITTTIGTGLNQIGQVIAYNFSTKEATIHKNWDVVPDNTTGYMINDTQFDLIEKPIWELDQTTTPYQKNRPEFVFPLGDDDNGRFVLFPVPFRNDGTKVYALKQRYYVDLMRLDLSSTLMSTLYRRWRNLWIQGVVAKIMQDDDDSRAQAEEQKYRIALSQIIARETYGMDLSQMRSQVSDYT